MSKADHGLVIACSALRRSYRDLIRNAAPDAFFATIDVEPPPEAVVFDSLSAVHRYFVPARRDLGLGKA